MGAIELVENSSTPVVGLGNSSSSAVSEGVRGPNLNSRLRRGASREMDSGGQREAPIFGRGGSSKKPSHHPVALALSSPTSATSYSAPRSANQ